MLYFNTYAPFYLVSTHENVVILKMSSHLFDEVPFKRWEENIKMDFQEVGCGGMDWTQLAQDREK
jgi:hypothetical protein